MAYQNILEGGPNAHITNNDVILSGAPSPHLRCQLISCHGKFCLMELDHQQATDHLRGESAVLSHSELWIAIELHNSLRDNSESALRNSLCET